MEKRRGQLKRMIHGAWVQKNFYENSKKQDCPGENSGRELNGEKWRTLDVLNKVEINKRGRKEPLTGCKIANSEALSTSNSFSRLLKPH